MSTHVTTMGGNAARERVEPGGWLARVYALLLAAGEAKGRREVLAYLSSQTDQSLAKLGYSAADIREIRQHRLPARRLA